MVMTIDDKIIAVGSFFLIYLILFAIGLKLRRKVYGQNMEYDERQERVRGLAYKRGFYTLIYGIMINGFAKEILDVEWATPMTELVLFMSIAIVVVSGTCIFQDAYFAPFAKGKNMIFTTIIIGVMNLFIGVRKVLDHQSLDEFQRFSNIQLILGILLISIPVMAYIHEILQERGDVE